MNDAITVIIPTYNKADFISQTIESVLQQTYKNFEIVIIDDCSSDNTEHIVQKYLSGKIRYFKHKTNWGPGATFNDGIEKAQSEYVTLIASDDILLPNHLELIMQEFKKDEHLDVVFSRLAVIDENNNITNERRINTNKDKYSLIRQAFYVSNIFPSPGVAFNKTFFKQIGLFNTGLILMHDYALNIKTVVYGRFTILPQITVYYRRFSDNKKNLSALGEWQHNCEVFERNIVRDIIFDSIPKDEFTSFFPQFTNVGNTEYTNFLLIKEACLSQSHDLSEWGFSRIQKYLDDNRDFFTNNVFNFQYTDYIDLYKKRIKLNYTQLTRKQKLIKMLKKIIRSTIGRLYKML
ncbi:glycosyltransferase [Treponema denticola]|uniref:glycosyltransferase n=1 Tax=Treponema denticola TaxID=158 RepID=UPI0011C76B69|nr:glycosyltransferase [Treponema denticola]